MLQSCPTLCNPVDCSPPGSSVHGILQARILEWVAILSSKGYSQLLSLTSPALAGRFFIIITTTKPVCVCVCVADFSHQSFSVYSSFFELPEVRWAFKCCIFLNTKKVIKCIYCHSTLAESGTASQVPALKML